MSTPLNEQVQAAAGWIGRLRTEIGRVIVGQEQLVDRLLVGLLANGHVLLEGVPGLAKTLSVRTLAAAIQASFHRIQFTPDLLPADIVGTLIYSPQDGKYHATNGPVFANFVLADEINRAPAKVQSALLEAMQERQVTLGGETMPLPSPFLVLATENPIDQEGTYPLPEAQVDRFMFKVLLDYPSFEEERKILDRMAFTAPETQVKPVIPLEEILADAQARGPDPCGREGARLHRAPRLRHAQAGAIQARPEAFHPVRRVAARDDLPDAGRQGVGAAARPRLCDARGREEHRPRRAAPPHHPDLRSRGAGGDDRRHHQEDIQRRAGAVRQVRRPKSEVRRKAEIRRPNTVVRCSSPLAAVQSSDSVFGFPSASDFGFGFLPSPS